jgi:DNA-binding transcriptional ArsR family regulator
MKPIGYERAPQQHLDATFAALADPTRRAILRPRRLEAQPLAEVTVWLERYRQFWEGNFTRLDALLDELKPLDKKRSSRNQ